MADARRDVEPAIGTLVRRDDRGDASDAAVRLVVALLGGSRGGAAGDGDTAKALYAATVAGDNYYSAMAAARLGERVDPRVEPLPLDTDKVETIAARDAFLRVRELLLVGQRQLATSEWNYGYELLPAEERLQAIHLAARWGIYDVAVAMATSHGRFNDYSLLYPRPYADEVSAAKKLTDVEPHLLYGVLRQESLFRPDAASSAGALGVAQLTYATARETARRWQLPRRNAKTSSIRRSTSRSAPRTSRSCSSDSTPKCRWRSAHTTRGTPRPSGGCRRRPSTATCGSRTSRTTRRALTCAASYGTASCSAGSRPVSQQSAREWLGTIENPKPSR